MKFVEYGSTQNETVIFLHGGGLAPWNYYDEAERLQERFHIIIPMGAMRILRQLRIMPMKSSIMLTRTFTEVFL